MPLEDPIWDTIYATGETITIPSSPYTMLIETGTYTGFTVDAARDSGTYIEIEDNTTFTGTITINGDNVTLNCGTCVTFTNVLVVDGASCSIIMRNGCTPKGFDVNANADNFYFDGGGWDTFVNGANTNDAFNIAIGADGAIVKNVACQTSGGGGTSFDAIANSSERSIFFQCRVDVKFDCLYATFLIPL